MLLSKTQNNIDRFIFANQDGYTIVKPHERKFHRITIQTTEDELSQMLNTIEDKDLVDVKRLRKGVYKITFVDFEIPTEFFPTYPKAQAYISNNWDKYQEALALPEDPEF